MASTEQPSTGDAPVATADVVAKLNMPTTPPTAGAEKPAAGTADKGETKPANSSDYDATEHLMSTQEVSAKYGVQFDLEHPGKSQGLSSSEAASRLAENGPNKLSPPKDKPEWLKYLLQYTNPLLGLLIVAAALTFVAYAIEDPRDSTNIILGVVLLLVIFMLGTSQYFDERAAGNVAAQLRSLLPSNAIVIRDGKEITLPAPDLVTGDVIHLVLGSRVPADIKVIQSKDLKLDFSSLTGESDPIPMSTTAVDDKAHESRNIAFMSSQVLNGEGYGVVIRCGDNTFIGKINALASQTTGTQTTLERDINLFIKVVAAIAVTMAIVLFSAGMIRKMRFADAFVNGVVIVLVANIPQGLPATVTSALSVTAFNMKNVSVLVKKTDIIESLGSATRIASDKTGTLTQNKMTVMHCWVNRHSKSASEIVASVTKPQTTNTPSHLMRTSINNVSLARRSVTRKSVTPGSAAVDVKDMDELVPAAKKGGEGLSRVSATHTGQDMVSRMSVGRNSVGSGNIGQNLTRSSMMTFAVNVTKPEEAPGSVWDQLSPLTKLCIIACVANRAQFEKGAVNTAGERKVLGDATDSGLLRFCDKIMDVDDVRNSFESVFSIPFNSRNKWALNMVKIPGDADNYLVLIKGAPDYVIKKCGRYSYRDGEQVMDDQFLGDVMDSNEGYASMAERVIGHAYKIVPAAEVPTTEEEADAQGLLDNFAFMGLLSLIDPPRDAVPGAVESCRSAGVAVTMVTGDQPTTAEAVARKCGIITKMTRREVASQYQVPEAQVPLDDENIEALVIPGSMIETDLVTDDDWDKVLCKDEIVFARTTPQQKLKIVEQFQRRGEIVAVTGDGVNDAPALRKANIGVAMGSPESSEVAREAASVVLMEDDFASLVAAIREGRVLYDNLKKTIVYSLAHIPPEFVPVILVLAFGMPLALGSLLVLSIDLITSQLPAQSLAWEPAEANVMARPPRDIETERLVSFPLLTHAYLIVGGAQSLFAFLGWIWVYDYHGVKISDIFLLDPRDNLWLSRADTDPGEVAMSNGNTYTAEEQQEIVRQATSVWYITLIMSQAWHIWVCKTRRVSMFKHPGVVSNRTTFYGVFISLAIMVVCVYIPYLQDNVFFTSNPPNVQAWIPHFGFLVFIVVYTEWQKWLARVNPQHWFVRWFVW